MQMTRSHSILLKNSHHKLLLRTLKMLKFHTLPKVRKAMTRLPSSSQTQAYKLLNRCNKHTDQGHGIKQM